MRTDEQIRRDVEAELHWDPEIDETDVAVKTPSLLSARMPLASAFSGKERLRENRPRKHSLR
jgi:hypothetical protein